MNSHQFKDEPIVAVAAVRLMARQLVRLRVTAPIGVSPALQRYLF